MAMSCRQSRHDPMVTGVAIPAGLDRLNDKPQQVSQALSDDTDAH